MKHWLLIVALVGVGMPATGFAQQAQEETGEETGEQDDESAQQGPQQGRVRLTKAPELVEQAQAEYTDEAVENRIEGQVKLRLTISATGKVTKVEVLEGLGYGLDQAAVEAAKQFVFTPAEINNQPAPVTLDFAIGFSLPLMPATFQGKVVDADTGQPIAGATVAIKYVGDEYEPAPEAQMPSESDGTFTFSDVPPGPYAVMISPTAYKDRSEQVELGSGETVDVTYRFSKSPINLRGEVREAGTRKPLAGVEVQVVDPETGDQIRQTYSDADAKFAFRGLEPGKYRLVFDAESYESFSSEETVDTDKVTSGTFYLRAEYYDEYTVKTTAQREQREVSKQRIDLKELRRIPGTGGDVVRVVQNMPGVARPSYVAGSLVVRGAAPEDTQVFLQGDTIPLVFHFLGGPAVVSSEMLEGVDFYPGNFSAYYGRATGGVVALRTRSPRDDRFHGFTEIDLIDATAQFEGPISENVSFALSARRSYIDAVLPVLAPDELTDQVTVSPRYYDYQGWLTWRATDAHKFELFLYGSDDKIATVFDDDEPQGNTNVQVTGASFGQLFHRGQVRWEWRPEGEPIESDFSASFGLNRAGFEAADNLYLTIDYYQTQIREDFRIEAADNLNLRFGADLQLGAAAYELQLPRSDRDRNSDFGDDGNGGVNLSPNGVVADETVPILQPAVYAEAEYEPFETLKIIPGIRADYYGQIRRTSVSPRISSRWKMLDNLTLKGGVGLFTQPPLPNESGTVFGTDKITFEKAMHYAVGSEWRILDYVELDSTLFFRDMFDLVEPTSAVNISDDGTAENVLYNNLGEGRAYGLELLLRHYPQNRFFGWVSYTLSRAERYDPLEDAYEPFRYDQTHILTMVAGYNLPYDIDVSSRFRLVTGTPYTPVVGSVWDADEDDYDPVYGSTLSARNGTFHQLDVRIDKKFIFDTFIIGAYIEVLNAYNAVNEEGRQYNYDSTESAPVPSLPIIPTLGVNGRF
ncbi:TonB family protein [Persicimonas caeni]|nr:TonB family protein [Persicimonas caeni]